MTDCGTFSVSPFILDKSASAIVDSAIGADNSAGPSNLSVGAIVPTDLCTDNRAGFADLECGTMPPDLVAAVYGAEL